MCSLPGLACKYQSGILESAQIFVSLPVYPYLIVQGLWLNAEFAADVLY